jgi:AraC-like DNA-binding protein
MKEHTSDQFTLEGIARKFNYSPSRFSNLFKTKTGYSPIDYFIHLKMQKACQLLDLTDTKINNLALKLGYDDPYHFSKAFKNKMGVSPHKYRTEKRGCI